MCPYTHYTYDELKNLATVNQLMSTISYPPLHKSGHPLSLYILDNPKYLIHLLT